MSDTLGAIRAACTAKCMHESALGPMLLARSQHGLCGAWFDGQAHHPGPIDAPDAPQDALLREAALKLDEYFDGRRQRFALPLDLIGTPFQRSVWTALLSIGTGLTRSYGDLARDLGAPRAVRAVGAAVGRNPVSVIVPCHRAIAADGTLTGYAGGLHRKRALLTLEAALPIHAPLTAGRDFAYDASAAHADRTAHAAAHEGMTP